jgi:protein disulfide-isomerase-like protein
MTMDSTKFLDESKKGVWQALYFHAPWCKYCDCLSPVWQGVSNNLVGSQRQPELFIGDVDGDSNPELRNLFNVTVYPTFVVVNKDGSKVLGRYLGPRKVFELSNWIEDLIVADNAPIVKHQFDVSEQGTHTDLNPVYPFSGPKAFPAVPDSQMLASVDASLVDECLESDESKYTGMDTSALVHVSADSADIHALEMDSSTVSPAIVPEKLMVIDFFAPWCPHCQHLAPVWDNVGTHFKDQNVVVGKVDVEAHPDVKNSFGVHRFPTIMYFEAGKPMQADENRRYKGARDEQSLENWIGGLMAKKD